MSNKIVLLFVLDFYNSFVNTVLHSEYLHIIQILAYPAI